MDGNDISNSGKCPVVHGTATNAASRGRSNADWWPDQLNLRILKAHAGAPPPIGHEFGYIEAFKSLDFQAMKEEALVAGQYEA